MTTLKLSFNNKTKSDVTITLKVDDVIDKNVKNVATLT